MTDQEIKVKKVLTVQTRLNFVLFVRYFFRKQYKQKWKQWEHLLIIADALQKVAEGKITRLIINVAPRYGKTELAVKMFIAWGLALNAAAKFIHLSYSDSLAHDNSETVKDLVTSVEYKELYPEVVLKVDSKSKKKWYTEDGGGVYATSAGGQITGFGAGRVDADDEDSDEDIFEEFLLSLEEMASNPKAREWLGDLAGFNGAIVIDDANKPDDAESETKRNQVNERYDSTISNRTNSRRTPIVLLQQRTHEDDLSGYLIRKQGEAGKIKDDGEPGIWHVISLPSIKADGTALCPDKHTIVELRALQKHNEVVFQRQHQQDPKPRAGLMFPSDDLKYYDPATVSLDNSDFAYACCDPSNGNGGDDYAAMDTQLIDDRIYVANIIYNNQDADYNEEAFEALIRMGHARAIGYEGVLAYHAAGKRVREALEKKNFTGEFRILKPRTNKHVRITAKAAFIKRNFYFRKDWRNYSQYAKFMGNLTTYLKIQEAGKGNKTDDAPDLCEMAAAYYESAFPHLWEMK